MNRRVLAIYYRVMALPEGLPYKEYRKELSRKVHALPRETRQDILNRADEIDEEAQESYEANEEILYALGFTETEVEFFARCRINSPGIRTLIKERVVITQYATPEQIKQINQGDSSVLNALKMLYVKGGEEDG